MHQHSTASTTLNPQTLTHTRTHAHTRAHACTHHTHTCTHTRTHARTHGHTQTPTQTHTCTHACTHAHTHRHTNTHTHTALLTYVYCEVWQVLDHVHHSTTFHKYRKSLYIHSYNFSVMEGDKGRCGGPCAAEMTRLDAVCGCYGSHQWCDE